MQLKDNRGSLERLIVFSLFDYKHKFMVRLNIIDSKLQTQVVYVSLLFAYGTRMQLTPYSLMLNQLQN